MVAKIRHPTPVLKNLHTLFAWKILYPVGFLRLITTLSSPCSFDHTTYKIPNPYSSFLLLLGHLHDWMTSLERAPLYYKLTSSSSPRQHCDVVAHDNPRIFPPSCTQSDWSFSCLLSSFYCVYKLHYSTRTPTPKLHQLPFLFITYRYPPSPLPMGVIIHHST